jgi:hypothetical protein
MLVGSIEREALRGRSVSASEALGIAVACSVVGSMFGFLAGVVLYPEVPYFHRAAVHTASAFGAGVGGFIGTVAGLARNRWHSPTRPWEAWTLRGIAALLLIVGLGLAWWKAASYAHEMSVLQLEFLPEFTRRRWIPFRNVVWLDAVLAAIACLVLARTRFRRAAIAVWAVASVGILITAALQLTSSDLLSP